MSLDKIKIIDSIKINHDKGDIFKIITKNDHGFNSFEEVYASRVNYNQIKAWKLHKKMTLNLVVLIGSVKFVFYDNNRFSSYIIGEDNYKRIVVPPNIWFGFKGLSKSLNLVINVANLIHHDQEIMREDVNKFPYDWSVN